MTHTEEFEPFVTQKEWGEIKKLFKAGPNDAQIIFWGPEDDIETALETIEERCQMAFKGVPNETRKSFEDGTTIFERVLPGADRMYPDTDSPPIPLEEDYIREIEKRLPTEIAVRYNQLKKWKVPENTYTYIFSHNLFPLIQDIVKDLKIDPRFVGTFIGQKLKFVEGHYICGKEFNYTSLFKLFKFLVEQKLDLDIAKKMLPVVFENPKMDFESILTVIKFKRQSEDQVLKNIPFLKNKFQEIGRSKNGENEKDWIMGELRPISLGNVSLSKLYKQIDEI